LINGEYVPLEDQSITDLQLVSLSHEEHEEDKYPPGSFMFWMCILIATGLTCTAGLMSGLTVGLLSIDRLDLELKMRTGTVEEKRNGK
jgi:hypothetical protein